MLDRLSFLRRAYHFTMFKVKYNPPHCVVAGTQSTIRGHRKIDAAGHLFGCGQPGWPSFRT